MDANDDTEFNLMVQGKPYLASDPYIGRVATAQRAKLRAINVQLDATKRTTLLHDFFTVTDEGESAWEIGIVEPFFCEYGFNIHIGNDTVFNTGCVILDVCPGMTFAHFSHLEFIDFCKP
ncbi:hypothetical protein B0H17DRAFT_299562 [Mycena rosella]|uniref:Maltose/galactoside acetyltransferase domain-containing protein n=1 Tax=Mycena rosella TaxID=1033263 RepID=A0AAD7CV34_MYCRO|nr:hypothetical protein B0H17DRAFT_299562 [Mycena rosella]